MTIKPIFILSHARSGSTLLRWLLDSHPAICSPAELSLGRLCELLHGAIEATLTDLEPESTAAMCRRRSVAETRRILDGVLVNYCRAKGKQRWCEKSPSNVDAIDWLRTIYPQAHYVCLYRHAFDTAASALELYQDLPWVNQDYREGNDGDAVGGWIARWCDKTERLLALETDGVSCTMRLRYEDLVAEPDDAVHRLCMFLDVESCPGLVRQVFALPHDVGHGDPKVITSQTIESSRVGRGRHLATHCLPPALDARLTRLLETLGYARTPVALEARGRRGGTRQSIDTVADLFETWAPGRLLHFGHRLAAVRAAVGFAIRSGGAWTVWMTSGNAKVERGIDGAQVVLGVEASYLLDAANARITSSTLQTRLEVKRGVELLDHSLINRLLWVLFSAGAMDGTD